MKKIYDLTDLREMSGGDEVFIQEMLVTFLKNNQDYLRLLNEGFESKDWKVVKFNAHKIKPSILLFRIDSLKEVILDLNEFSGKEMNLDKMPALIGLLNSSLSEVFNEISAELKKE